MKKMNGVSIDCKISDAGHVTTKLNSWEMERACRRWLNARGIKTANNFNYGKQRK